MLPARPNRLNLCANATMRIGDDIGPACADRSPLLSWLRATFLVMTVLAQMRGANRLIVRRHALSEATRDD